MCGIVGAVAKRDVINILLDGLYHLEYRGYDSSGLAIIDANGNLQLLRRVGKVDALSKAIKESYLSGNNGIAHTRWATHGVPTENNAHPHISENIAVVHNGIIENYESLRNKLRQNGYKFISDTDTEVIAHLVHWEQRQKRGALINAVQKATSKLRGSYSIIIMDSNDPCILIAASSGNSLIIGCGNNENFITSDESALLAVTNDVIFLEDGDIAEITYNTICIWDKVGKIVKRKKVKSQINYDTRDKGIYQHYMQKEIFEQPFAIRNVLKEHLNCGKITLLEFNTTAKCLLSKVKHIQIVACGTSYHSAMVSRYWFESLANLPCDVEIASEFCYRKVIVRPDSLFVTVSQSGETADTLKALRISKNLNFLGSLAICNTERSSLVRNSDIFLMTKAGLEISVASTKSFITQLTLLLILVIYMSGFHNITESLEKNIICALQKLPKQIEQMIQPLNMVIKDIAQNFYDKKHALFIGRGPLYPIAMEGALKLKEVAYIHAEAYAAGELKHGPLALIDSSIPVIVTAPNDKLLEKLKSNIKEIYSRGGLLYIFSDYKNNFIFGKNIKIISLPCVEQIIIPILYTVPMQLLAYHVGLIKGADIDQPRNLAKSVTVE